MTNEIKRLLRSLEEACAEEGFTIDDAFSWYKTLKKFQPILEERPKETTFRDLAELLVNSSSLDKPNSKKICIEILCMAQKAGEELLLTEDIVNHLLANKLIPEKAFGRDIAKNYIYEFLTDYYRKQGVPNPRSIIGKTHWRSLSYALRNLIKTLN